MKFLCVVLFALIGISAALAKDCYTDVECGSEFCFCMKGQYKTIGECECAMDPKFFNLKYPCTYDDDCIGKVDTQNGKRLCGCHRDKPIYMQPQGQCECYDPLY